MQSPVSVRRHSGKNQQKGQDDGSRTVKVIQLTIPAADITAAVNASPDPPQRKNLSESDPERFQRQ